MEHLMKCDVCKEQFVPAIHNQRFCTTRCKMLHNNCLREGRRTLATRRAGTEKTYCIVDTLPEDLDLLGLTLDSMNMDAMLTTAALPEYALVFCDRKYYDVGLSANKAAGRSDW